MTYGLIVGRFLPPHAGHQLLVETALSLVDDLTIVLCLQEDDIIPGGQRRAWLRELFPQARLIEHNGALPGPEQAAAWQAIAPGPVDLLFGSDEEIAAIAQSLGAQAVLVDPERQCLPVTGAAVRADPAANWRHLPAPVRPYYARTICLHGPESTGKSTLAPRLADRFGTIFVPEYGRTYCRQHGLDMTMADLVEIGRTHAAMTAGALRRCGGGRLILDTDPLMTAVWADMLFGSRDPWFDRFAGTADLYLLLDIDMAWVDDGTRFFGTTDERRRFFDLSRAELDRRQLRYEVIGGRPEERLARAVEAIARL